MADTTAVAPEATLPASTDVKRVAALTREPFVLVGETPEEALAPGTARRAAFDAALAEADDGAKVPSIEWRRDWALLLGLERILSEEEPTLVDGTLLSAHQVDALSGTLTALLAEAQRTGGAGAVTAEQDVVELPSVEVEIEGDDEDAEEEPQDWTGDAASDDDESQLPEQAEDPNAGKRFWFEHATGAGKSVAALGFVEACRTGGVLILTHRRNLVDQFLGELRDRGYKDRIRGPLLRGEDGISNKHGGPVTVETYQWFVRNAGNVSEAYQIVICDEAHTALGDKTSAAIRKWAEPIFIGMTATGALIARHVTDLFPTQTSRFDLAQAARRGVIAPLRCVRIPPGQNVRNIAKVPLRKGEVDVEFDQELLAEMLDILPFNLAIADLYKTRFNGVPGVVYAAGVKHAYNVAAAFRELGMKAQAVSGETPKRELAQILADYENGEVDVLVNAQLLAEGWNSPRATVCMHLAPTASRRIYQQRVGRVTRRHPGKEAGIVVDFVAPGTKHDDPVVTLHSLLGRDIYRGGAIVVGPVRRGRGRRLRVERRVLPVAADEDRRIEVFERELWRIAVEHLDYGEQVQWAALAGARVAPTGWRRARAMLHFDTSGELKRTFLTTALRRNKNPQLRMKALADIAQARDDEAFDEAVEVVGTWTRDDKREGVKTLLLALAERKLGKREQANNWIWRLASDYTREYHEEYAVQRWPETKRLLGLLVNSSGAAHARNARRLVQATRDKDRRLAAAVLAAALPHTAEAGEVVNGARMRMSRKPGALARELLRNLPKGGKSKRRRKKRKGAAATDEAAAAPEAAAGTEVRNADPDHDGAAETAAPASKPARRRRRRGRGSGGVADAAATTDAATASEATREDAAAIVNADAASAPEGTEPKPKRRRSRAKASDSDGAEPEAEAAPKPRARRTRAATDDDAEPATDATPKSRARRTRAATDDDAEPTTDATPKPRARRAHAGADDDAEPATDDDAEPTTDATPKPRARRSRAGAVDVGDAGPTSDATPKPRARRARAEADAEPTTDATPKPRARRARAGADDDAEPTTDATPKPRARRTRATAADADESAQATEAKAAPRRSRAKSADADGAAADAGGAQKPRAHRSRAKAADARGADDAAEPPATRARADAAPKPPAGDPPAVPAKPRRRSAADRAAATAAAAAAARNASDDA